MNQALETQEGGRQAGSCHCDRGSWALTPAKRTRAKLENCGLERKSFFCLMQHAYNCCQKKILTLLLTIKLLITVLKLLGI